jgi:hypothetical protein
MPNRLPRSFDARVASTNVLRDLPVVSGDDGKIEGLNYRRRCADRVRPVLLRTRPQKRAPAPEPERPPGHGGLFGQGNDLLPDVRMAQPYPPLSGSRCIATKTMVKSRTLQAVAPIPAFMASSMPWLRRENGAAVVA